ncbi:MAG: 4Fe-4S binding protein, partial [Candidatus Heimdallarchaeota archaeon]|nr:4Fe-4S binding protein [Candidatus Heimdallarchaeota archaeon]MCK4253028.1 4Fe-4S binding protein [Candidatus Heimdallarchaeota archaeon]
SQAGRAAVRACNIIAQDEIEVEATIAHVDEILCRGCGICVGTCPYSAITLIDTKRFGNIYKVASVNEALCKGCGSCAAACLNGAINQFGFEDKQILAMIQALGEE